MYINTINMLLMLLGGFNDEKAISDTINVWTNYDTFFY